MWGIVIAFNVGGAFWSFRDIAGYSSKRRKKG